MSAETARKVRNWWNENPFTYNGALGVGKQAAVDGLDLAYFDDVERRYKKHTDGATQDGDAPVFSRYISHENLRGKKVLDIATGTGFSTVTFARYGALVTGIDITPYAVAATKRNLSLRGLEGEVLQMDAQRLGFPDNSFDYVCAHGCLMHIPETEKAVREIHRVLKPGGEAYAWMYHCGWYYWFGIMLLRGVLLGKLFTHKFNPLLLTSRYSDGAHSEGNPHTKFYSRSGLRNLFAQAGFKDTCVYANHNPSEWGGWPMRSFSVGRFVPRKVQSFLSANCGFALGCSITTTKR
jgi:SAM-dependent methyltransferase